MGATLKRKDTGRDHPIGFADGLDTPQFKPKNVGTWGDVGQDCFEFWQEAGNPLFQRGTPLNCGPHWDAGSGS